MTATLDVPRADKADVGDLRIRIALMEETNSNLSEATAILMSTCRRIRAEREELKADIQEAWKIVNALAGQEYWDRAEEWLTMHEWAKPAGIQRL